MVAKYHIISLMQLTIRYATNEEIESWDKLVLANNPGADFLSSHAFANIKAKYGWKPRFLVYESDSTKRYVVTLEKEILLLGKLWYQPSLTAEADWLDAMITANKAIRQLDPAVFLVRIDVPISEKATKVNLPKAHSIQPAHTIVLDVSGKSSEDLLEKFDRRARRDIRLSIRKGVQPVELEPTEATKKQMFELMKTAAGGKGFAGLRSYQYYSDFWDEFVRTGYGKFYGAYEGKKLVVSAFVIQYGQNATYKDAGSDPTRDQSAQAAHGVQWQIIQDLNKAGVKNYDLLGVPASDKIDDPNDPLYGVGRFKTSFSHDIIDHLGAFDIALKPLAYKIWRGAGQKLAYKIHYTKTHENYY